MTDQQMRAWMCPNCLALLSESLVGNLASRSLPTDGWRCAECGETNEFDKWTSGVWMNGVWRRDA